MRIDELDQEDADIDWFAVDAAGSVIHFASGGGRLPESVAASEENLLALHQYFLGLPETAEPAVVPVASGAAGGVMAPGAVRYARRGLYSYYKTSLREPADPRYHLVARPVRPLTIHELPTPLAALLSCTRLPVAAADTTQLNATTIA